MQKGVRVRIAEDALERPRLERTGSGSDYQRLNRVGSDYSHALDAESCSSRFKTRNRLSTDYSQRLRGVSTDSQPHYVGPTQLTRADRTESTSSVGSHYGSERWRPRLLSNSHFASGTISEGDESMDKVPSLHRKRSQSFAGGDHNIYVQESSLCEELCEALKKRCYASQRHRKSTAVIREEMINVASRDDDTFEVNVLKDEGFLNEDLCRVVYAEHRDDPEPELLQHMRLNLTGGIDCCGELWYDEKYFWFFYLIISVIFNIASLILMNWGIFHSCVQGIQFSLQTLDKDLQHPSAWKIWGGLVNMTSDISSATQRTTHQVERQSSLNKMVFQHIHDSDTQHRFLYIAAFVAVWEGGWVVAKVFHSLYLSCVFCFDSSEYRRYQALRIFFLRLLPQFSTFSVLKLMAKVHPTIIYNGFINNLNDSAWRSTRIGMVGSSTCFVLEQVLAAVAALCAFAVKILAVGFALLDTNLPWFLRYGSCLSLMVQCMGCILMEHVLQDRLLLFVFGGEDATYQDDEAAYKNVYECRLTKQIWSMWWDKEGTFVERLRYKFKAIVLLATFDHYDMQKLLVMPAAIGLNIKSQPPSNFYGSSLAARFNSRSSNDETDEWAQEIEQDFDMNLSGAGPMLRRGTGLTPIQEVSPRQSRVPDSPLHNLADLQFERSAVSTQSKSGDEEQSAVPSSSSLMQKLGTKKPRAKTEPVWNMQITSPHGTSHPLFPRTDEGDNSLTPRDPEPPQAASERPDQSSVLPDVILPSASPPIAPPRGPVNLPIASRDGSTDTAPTEGSREPLLEPPRGPREVRYEMAPPGGDEDCTPLNASPQGSGDVTSERALSSGEARGSHDARFEGVSRSEHGIRELQMHAGFSPRKSLQSEDSNESSNSRDRICRHDSKESTGMRAVTRAMERVTPRDADSHWADGEAV